MARYRKVATVIWNDERFRTLSDRAQLVFLFVLTHPHMTSLGAMRATVDGLCCEHGKWPPKVFSEAFQECVARGMVEVDKSASFIGLPKFLKHNGPENPNVVKSWGKVWDDIPECGLKTELIERVCDCIKSLSKGFAKALPEPFRKGMPIPEQEQEHEQEPEQDHLPLPPPESPPVSSSQPDQWAAVEGELLSEGIAKARDVARGARARGCSHLEVRAALEHWRAHRPTWDAGALVRRLENLEHGQEIATPGLWPPSSKAAQIAESRERSFEKQAELEAEKANAKQKLKQNASKMQELEGRYGGYLDSMTEKQIRKFATNCGLEFLLKSYRGKEGVRGLLRESLLQDLANANFQIPEGVPA